MTSTTSRWQIPTGRAVWRSADVHADRSWCITLTDPQRTAIVDAANRSAAEDRGVKLADSR